MTESPPRRARVSRESRLLLLTVAVCAVVLLLLARLRFPHPPAAAETAAPAPLERLAARAAYDALAADIQRIEPEITRHLVLLRIGQERPPAAHELRDALEPPDAPFVVRHVAALRIGETAAVAAVDGSTHIAGIVAPPAQGTAALVGVDPIRRIGRIRVPGAAPPPLSLVSLNALPTPLYIVVVEGTQAGVTLRPVFLGRGDRYQSNRWNRPLLPLGGVAVGAGALLFTLSGDFIGMVVVENGAAAIAGARDVLDAAERLAGGTPTPGDAGIAVQPLTPPLATALNVSKGVVVAAVRPGSPAQDRLEPGDVITAVGDWSTDDPDELLLRLATHSAGEPVAITAIRNGAARTVTLDVDRSISAGSPRSVALAAERGLGTRVDHGSGVTAPGLEPGDVIVRAGSIVAPSPSQVRRLLAQPTPGGFAILVVRRDGRQRVVAVPSAGRSDAAGR
jgi:hypothetical protein